MESGSNREQMDSNLKDYLLARIRFELEKSGEDDAIELGSQGIVVSTPYHAYGFFSTIHPDHPYVGIQLPHKTILSGAGKFVGNVEDIAQLYLQENGVDTQGSLKLVGFEDNTILLEEQFQAGESGVKKYIIGPSGEVESTNYPSNRPADVFIEEIPEPEV